MLLYRNLYAIKRYIYVSCAYSVNYQSQVQSASYDAVTASSPSCGLGQGMVRL